MGRTIVAGSCALAFAAGWNIANVGPIAEREAQAYGVGLATREPEPSARSHSSPAS